MTDKYYEIEAQRLEQEYHDRVKSEYEQRIAEDVYQEFCSVAHPKHYTQYKNFEVIDITSQLPFLEGNIIKYVLRHKEKNGVEDLRKAAWYLNYLIEQYK